MRRVSPRGKAPGAHASLDHQNVLTMSDPPPPPEEPDYAWLDRFGRVVIAVFLLGIALGVLVLLIACEKPPDTLVPLQEFTTTTTVPVTG